MVNLCLCTLKFIHVNDDTVSSIITSLYVHKVTGADGLPARFIRASPHMVRLTGIIVLLNDNKCIVSSLVPYQ